MNPFRLLICFMALCHLSQASQNALFYDLSEKQLVEISKFDEKAECKFCISACPAASNSIEELFNEKESLTKNSIFMRDVYSSPTTADEMKIEICEKLFSPSLLWNIRTATFNVGYEMYYEKGRIDLISTGYDYYAKVVNGEPSFESKDPMSEDRIKIHRESKNIEFELDNEPEKNLGFSFITAFYYDVLKDGNSRVVRYNEDTINDYQHQIRTISYCQNYFLGDDTQIIGKKQEEIDNQVQLLTKNLEEGTPKQPENTSNLDKNSGEGTSKQPENTSNLEKNPEEATSKQPENISNLEKNPKEGTFEQPKTTSNLEWNPKEGTSKQPENTSNLEKNPEEGTSKQLENTSNLEKSPEEGTSKQHENSLNRLIKAQILPMRMFHTMASRLATCMYLNFAFVWENIVNTTLKKIDLYLYALYRTFPLKIILSFGVDGDLQEKQEIDTTAREEIASEHHLFNKFPVPEILLRFVKVMVNLKRYGVVIVIHNNVKSVDDSDRICSVEDEIESWDGITNMDVKTGLTYVCALTQNVFEKLGYNKNISPEIMSPILPLKLNNFPFRSDKRMVTFYKSVLDEIDQKLSYIKQMHIEY